jgi:hypothetical protein
MEDIKPLVEWLVLIAQKKYGYSEGRKWILPKDFTNCFGYKIHGETLELYCQQPESKWLVLADEVFVDPTNKAFVFSFLSGKIEFFLLPALDTFPSMSKITIRSINLPYPILKQFEIKTKTEEVGSSSPSLLSFFSFNYF